MPTIKGELISSAQEASKKYGIPVSVILGFAGLETQYGETGMGKSKNNLFGIGKNVYNSISESVEDFARLVTGQKSSAQSKKYGQATAGASSNEEWVNAIRDAGYNSEYADGVYEQKILDVINSHGLNDYNLESSGGNTPELGGGSFGGGDTEESFSSSGGSFAKNIGLEWWGDIVRVVFAVLLVIGGFAFLGLAITGGSGAGKINDIVKEVS